MANQLLSLIRRCTGRKLPERLFDAMNRVYPNLWRRSVPPTSSYGGVWTLVTPDANTAALLDAIPSETTKAERRFLYHFFRSAWDGRGDVLEVGPFLGGTTRAIALGMWHHPARNPEALMHVYDRFDTYYSGEELAAFVDPLFAKGILKPSDREAILRTASFEYIFHKVHEGQAYHDLIRCTNGPLPDEPSEEARIPVIFQPPPGRTLSAVFIDGCKSWYGTRYFMEKVVATARPGAWFIAQDYSQYTCFWLPAFFEAFAESFELHAYVDSTYCFQLKRPLAPEEVRARFPMEPEAWGPERLGALFKRLVHQARERDDQRSRVVYTMQWAAALAYIGRKDEARRMFDDLLAAPWTYGSEDFIRHARKSPTYRSRMDGSEEVHL